VAAHLPSRSRGGRRGASVRARVALALAVALAGLLAGCSLRAERCEVCERDIHPQVRATLTLGSGRQLAACCPRCALHYGQENSGAVRSIAVKDYASGELLPLERAWLVEGSDVTPCLHLPPLRDDSGASLHLCYDRCMPSLIAFRDEAASRAFLAEHGGTVLGPGGAGR